MPTNSVRPTQLLRAFLLEHPQANDAQLADLYVQQYPRVSPAARRVISRWGVNGARPGYLPDDQVDRLLEDLLRDAGYGV